MGEAQWRAFATKREAIAREQERLRDCWVRPELVPAADQQEVLGEPLRREVRALDLLARPQVNYAGIVRLAGAPPEPVDPSVAEQIEIQCHYDGYIVRQQAEIDRQREQESKAVPHGHRLRAGPWAVHGGPREARTRAPGHPGSGGAHPRRHPRRAVAPVDPLETPLRLMPSAAPLDPAGCLVSGGTALGIPLNAEQIGRLLAFLALLGRWNLAYNLTAVRDPQEQVPRHLLDSLTVLPYLLGDTVLDLGTGAGLPGLPLAICDPDRRYCLLDGNGKKVRFVRQVVMELGLPNVEAVHSRIESYRPGRKFSTIVTRAVAAIAEIHTQAAPLLDRPGRLLVMKGRYPEDELRNPALSDLNLAVHPLCVPFLEGDRHLIEIRRE